MNNMKNKKMASLIATILIATIALSFAYTPTTSARLREYDNMAYVAVAPTTVGVGQTVSITFWADKLPPTAIGEYGDRWTFDVYIIKPDGTNVTISDIESDSVGGAYTTFTPDQTGNYTIQAYLQEHVIDGGASRGELSPGGVGWWPSGSVVSGWDPIGVVFNDAYSAAITLEVTDEQVANYEENPLPTDYWTRPVYDTNRGWSTVVMGQWLGASELVQYGNSGKYNPYSTGPSSAHILWSSPYSSGGIAGGVSTVNSSSSDNSYYSGQSYENYGGPSIVLNGRVYVVDNVNPREGFYCYDLYTGEVLYYSNSTGSVSGVTSGGFYSTGGMYSGQVSFGQVLVYDSPNQHGTLSYYWVTTTDRSYTWDMYDDYSASYICSIANTTWSVTTPDSRTVTQGATGTSAVGTDGSILRYNLVNLGTTTSPSWYLQVWNTSQAIMYPQYQRTASTGSNVEWMWRPGLNATYNGRNGFSANVSTAITLQGSSLSIRQVIPDEQMVVIYAGANNGTVSTPGTVYCIDLSPGNVGDILYKYNFTAPASVGDSYGQSEQYSNHDPAFNGVNIQEGIFWYTNAMTQEYYIYDLDDGSLLWTAPAAEQFAYYGMGTVVVYDGQFIDCGGYSGVVRAFNAQNGNLLWNWTAESVGIGETSYPFTPTYFGCLSGDGLLYLYSSEHSVNNPIRRDAKLWCVNASSGDEVWSLTCWPSTAPILADGRLLVLDSHDNEIYCYGKGASATTLSTMNTVPTLGSSIQITGTVTDDSVSGRMDTNGNVAVALKGTPAISDESMAAWMEYLYRQDARPTDATGVDVYLYAIDPNGNYIDIGTTTSDSYGNYAIAYQPEVPGTYQIIATFAGTNSYYSSSASSYLTVGSEASTPTPAPTSNSEASIVSAVMTYTAAAAVAIIVAIAIAVVLILNKKH
ncbi:MAG: PQQ-binding-like beta-propeller repeat protein [Candidatus Bathyarchaeota archaeon]|nr:PQQ-binding-like beta-propeller repeat protein [Candidatus Bathyarchaeota archaeon]